MSTPITFNGVSYSIPAYNDTGYAQGAGNLSAYLIAIASGTLQQSGGTFSLTADTNFGNNFGLIAKYYKSTTSTVASAGQIRLANSDTIDWRNFLGNGNLALSVNSADQLVWNGAVVTTGSASAVFSITGTANQVFANQPSGNVTLSLPQDIALTSSPTFSNVTATLTSPTSTPATAGEVRLAKTDAIEWRNTLGSGNLPLAIDGSDNLTYNGNIISASGSGPVTSITGTSNQVNASSPTGAVTLSLPQSIATTSNVQFGHILSSGNPSLGNGGITVTDPTAGTTALISLNGSSTPGISFSPSGSASSLYLKVAASIASLRNVVIPDSGSSTADVVLTEGAQVINGTKTFGTPVPVGSGGTANTTFTAYSVICAGTTATGAFQNVSGVGASGQVLTSNGPALLPTWQNASGTGTVNSGTATHIAYYATSTNVVSDANGATLSGAYTWSGVNTYSVQDIHSAGISITGTTDSTGITGFTGANFISASASSSNALVGMIENTNTGANAHAVLALIGNTSGTGNQYISLNNGKGGAHWSMGQYNVGGAHSFQIANDSVLGTPILEMTTAGVATFNTQLVGKGTATNNSAAAGYIGEYIESVITAFTNTAASNTASDLTTITLTAGDWDVSLNGFMKANGGTWSETGMWIGTTAGNSFAEFTVDRTSTYNFANTATVITIFSHAVPSFRMSLSTSTTVRLKFYALFSAGQPQGSGRISARRVR